MKRKDIAALADGIGPILRELRSDLTARLALAESRIAELESRISQMEAAAAQRGGTTG